MSRRDNDSHTITPDVILRAYAIGIFPMAENADDPSLHWVEPRFRGIIPLDGLKVSKSLAKTIRSNRFDIRVDHDFAATLTGCATRPGDTWINARIKALFGTLFERGMVHTVEVYANDELVGGIYGLSIGAAFFGESMFHRVTDASKIALMHLSARLFVGGYHLFDTQFLTPHLASLGGIEITRNAYQERLVNTVMGQADFARLPIDGHHDGREILHIISSKASKKIP